MSDPRIKKALDRLQSAALEYAAKYGHYEAGAAWERLKRAARDYANAIRRTSGGTGGRDGR